MKTFKHILVPTDFSDTAREVDAAIAAGRIDRRLPFVRREGVKLLTANHPTADSARPSIDMELRRFYQSTGQSADQDAVRQAVAALQASTRATSFPR